MQLPNKINDAYLNNQRPKIQIKRLKKKLQVKGQMSIDLLGKDRTKFMENSRMHKNLKDIE